MNRFDDEVVRPFLGSSASQLAIRDGQMSAAYPLEYLIKAKMLQRRSTPKDEQSLPHDVTELVALQSSNGQWLQSERLNRALGANVPEAPPGVQDWRWATALAVIYLRRNPAFFEATFDVYSRASAWVDDSLLAEAHKRLPPPDLYYPVEGQAVREGRWQEQVAEALEDCGYEYFIPGSAFLPNSSPSVSFRSTPETAITPKFTRNGKDSSNRPGQNRNSALHKGDVSSTDDLCRSSAVGVVRCGEHDTIFDRRTSVGTKISIATTTGGLSQSNNGRPRRNDLRTWPTKISSQRTKRRQPPARGEGTSRTSLSHNAIEREASEQRSGLCSEMKQVAHAVRTTFRIGDRIESRWRRPTRLDRPRVDFTGTWHSGRVVGAHKDGRVDVVFNDRDSERLSGISNHHVRLAPRTVGAATAIGRACSATEREPTVGSIDEAHDVTQQNQMTTATDLCPASRRELAHIACRASIIRRTWKESVTMDMELTRLKTLQVVNTRSRPVFNVSFPAVSFETAKRLPFGETTGLGLDNVSRRQKGLNKRVCDPGRRRHLGIQLSHGPELCPSDSPSKHQKVGESKEHQLSTSILRRHDDRGRRCRESIALSKSFTDDDVNPKTASADSPALIAAQFSLVSHAMVYDRYVESARDCLDRGAAAYRAARTCSEQQAAFEEATAMLGPAQPARAGYRDWRGRPVGGLQTVTLGAVEAMEAWANEWAAAKGGSADKDGKGKKNWNQDENEAFHAERPPPFVWEGKPLVLTIMSHTEKLVRRVPELKDWYGPGFPMHHNPFCLAYPIDDRPRTPCNASVRALVNGEMTDTVSPMLLKQRTAEESTLRAILEKQAAVPSWWPAAQGIMSEAHYDRLRRAEKGGVGFNAFPTSSTSGTVTSGMSVRSDIASDQKVISYPRFRPKDYAGYGLWFFVHRVRRERGREPHSRPTKNTVCSRSNERAFATSIPCDSCACQDDFNNVLLKKCPRTLILKV